MKGRKATRLTHAKHTFVIRKPYVEKVTLSKAEAQMADEIASRFGITAEEATTLVVKASIARRMKKRTGKAPAKVYSIRKKA